LGPTVERICAFAGLDFGKLGDDAETFGCGERNDCLALRLKAKAALTLLFGANPLISDDLGHFGDPLGTCRR
jgi:hypothetical protein